jgi:hypothetical protein
MQRKLRSSTGAKGGSERKWTPALLTNMTVASSSGDDGGVHGGTLIAAIGSGGSGAVISLTNSM